MCILSSFNETKIRRLPMQKPELLFTNEELRQSIEVTQKTIHPNIDKLVHTLFEEYVDLVTAEIFFDPVIISNGDSIERESFEGLIEDFEKKKEQQKKDKQEKQIKDEIQLLHPANRLPIEKTVIPNNTLRTTIKHILKANPERWVDVYIPKSLQRDFEKALEFSNLDLLNNLIQKHPRLLIEKMKHKVNAITFIEYIFTCASSENISKIIHSYTPYNILLKNQFKFDGIKLFNILLARNDINNIKLLSNIFGWQASFYLNRVYNSIESKNAEELSFCLQLCDFSQNPSMQESIINFAGNFKNYSLHILKILIKQFNLMKLVENIVIDQIKENVLYQAIIERAENVVQQVLLDGVNGLKEYGLNETAFHMAVKADASSILKLLFEYTKMDDIVRCKMIFSLLNLAISLNYVNMVKYLLSLDIKLNTYNEQYSLSLHAALRSNNPLIINLFIKNADNYQLLKLIIMTNFVASDIEALEKHLNWSAETYLQLAWLAVENKDINILGICCLKGIDLNAISRKKKYKGQTLLHIALLSQFDDVINLLLDAGAGLDVQNREGNTPLHCAAMVSKEDILRRIIAKSPRQSHQINKKNQYPFQVAKEYKNENNARILFEFFKNGQSENLRSSSISISSITNNTSQVSALSPLKEELSSSGDSFFSHLNKTLSHIQFNNTLAVPIAKPLFQSDKINVAVRLNNNKAIEIVDNGQLLKTDYGDLLLYQKRVLLIEKLITTLKDRKDDQNCIFSIQLLSYMKVCNTDFRDILYKLFGSGSLDIVKETTKALVRMMGCNLKSWQDNVGLSDMQHRIKQFLINHLQDLETELRKSCKDFTARCIIEISKQINVPSDYIILLLRLVEVLSNQEVKLEAVRVLIRLMPLYEQIKRIPLEKSYIIHQLNSPNDKIKEIAIDAIEVDINSAFFITQKLLSFLLDPRFINVQNKLFNKLSQFLSLSEELSKQVFTELRNHKQTIIEMIHKLFIKQEIKDIQCLLLFLHQLEEPSDTMKFIINKSVEFKESDKRCHLLSLLSQFKEFNVLVIQKCIFSLQYGDPDIDYVAVIILQKYSNKVHFDKKQLFLDKRNEVAKRFIKIIDTNTEFYVKLDTIFKFSELRDIDEGITNQFFILMNSLMQNYKSTDTQIRFLKAIQLMPKSVYAKQFLTQYLTTLTSIELIGLVIDELKQYSINEAEIINNALQVLQQNKNELHNLNAIQILRVLKTFEPRCIELLYEMLNNSFGASQYFVAIALFEAGIFKEEVVNKLLKVLTLSNEILFNNAIKALTAKNILNINNVQQIIDKFISLKFKAEHVSDELIKAVCTLFEKCNKLEYDYKDSFFHIEQELLGLDIPAQVETKSLDSLSDLSAILPEPFPKSRR